LNIIERLLSHATNDNDNDDDYSDDWSNDPLTAVADEQLSPGWRRVPSAAAEEVDKRSWRRGSRTLKRGPGSCINSCLTGGMSFVRCKSMCHWQVAA